jgi:uncharacterized SAM-binding protein YcdF (DUF218 family)
LGKLPAVRRKSRAFVWVWIAALAIAILFRTAILGALGSYLVHSDPPRRSDVIFVLAGDGDGNRIRKAGDLVRQGYAPKAIVSGPWIYGIHESELAIAFARRAGYPAESFVPFENDALSTNQEAQEAAAVLRGMGAKHVLLVTSDFHTRRAARIFRATMPDIDFDVVAALDSHFSPHGWWHSREGEKTFVMEWTKTLAGWLGI